MVELYYLKLICDGGMWMFNTIIGNTPMIKIIYEDNGKEEY